MKENNNNAIAYNRFYDYRLHLRSTIPQLVAYYMKYRNFFTIQPCGTIKIGELEMCANSEMHEIFTRYDDLGLKEFALEVCNEVSTEEETLTFANVCKTVRRIKDVSNNR